MSRSRRKSQGNGTNSFIKKIIKKIIGKEFFICEPFITVRNNTNSDDAKDC